VPYPPGPSAARAGDVVGTLRLLAYLALALALVVLDHRGGWLSGLRGQAEILVQPLWAVAGLPGRAVRGLSDNAGTRAQLVAENARLRNELLLASARMARLQVSAQENARLRGLLGAVERGGLDVQLAPVLDIDLDPSRQRLVLDAGSRDGVRVGQAVLDAGGLVGQVIGVMPGSATALLLTDPDHAVPVAVLRSGVRLVAYGDGRSDRLRVTNIPLSADVRVGDRLVTSGLGRRFPAGFPVGEVVSLAPDHSRAFLVAEVRPAAQLDRGRDVLLLRRLPDLDPAVPPPAAAAGAPDAAATPEPAP
jgi:rod shape-determining protein MreC